MGSSQKYSSRPMSLKQKFHEPDKPRLCVWGQAWPQIISLSSVGIFVNLWLGSGWKNQAYSVKSWASKVIPEEWVEKIRAFGCSRPVQPTSFFWFLFTDGQNGPVPFLSGLFARTSEEERVPEFRLRRLWQRLLQPHGEARKLHVLLQDLLRGELCAAKFFDLERSHRPRQGNPPGKADVVVVVDVGVQGTWPDVSRYFSHWSGRGKMSPVLDGDHLQQLAHCRQAPPGSQRGPEKRLFWEFRVLPRMSNLQVRDFGLVRLAGPLPVDQLPLPVARNPEDIGQPFSWSLEVVQLQRLLPSISNCRATPEALCRPASLQNEDEQSGCFVSLRDLSEGRHHRRLHGARRVAGPPQQAAFDWNWGQAG